VTFGQTVVVDMDGDRVHGGAGNGLFVAEVAVMIPYIKMRYSLSF
jgi:hypothetical protein